MRFEAVRAQLRRAVGSVFPSAQLVVCEGGHTVLDEAVGDCTVETLFDVASLTKALATTTLVMRLVERGGLRLDEELRAGVTVRLALAHASGLPAWRPLYERVDEDAPDARRAIVEAARREPLEAPPGERSVYSDLGFILLGDAVERAGGARLDAQWAEVAEQLGVGATFDPDPARCSPTRRSEGALSPDGWEALLAGTVHDDNALAMEGVAGHAGLFASARDVSAVAAALVAAWTGEERATTGKEAIARTETVRAFWTP